MRQTVDAYVGVYSPDCWRVSVSYRYIHICVRPLRVCPFYSNGQARASMRGTGKSMVLTLSFYTPLRADEVSPEATERNGITLLTTESTPFNQGRISG